MSTLELLIEPFTNVMVAVAVVPIPTNFSTPDGADIPMSTVPEYPEPPLVILIDVMVPAVDTISVAAAPTLISPYEISASTLNPDKPYFVS